MCKRVKFEYSKYSRKFPGGIPEKNDLVRQFIALVATNIEPERRSSSITISEKVISKKPD